MTWAGSPATDTARSYDAFEGLGFSFNRQAAGSHEIWLNPSTGRFTTVPNHPGDMPEGTLRAILRQAAVDPDEFLDA